MHVLAGLGQACLRWRPGRTGEEAEFVCEEFETVEPQQTSAPSTSRINCQHEILRWGQDNPALVPCVSNAEDYDRWQRLCARVQRGEITLSQARRIFTAFAQQQCAAQAPPPPPSMEPPPTPREPPPPPTAPPPHMPPGIPDAGDTPGDQPPLLEPTPTVTDDGATPSDDVTQRDWRRRFGPIVGIGLLVAAGLTVYRVKRKR